MDPRKLELEPKLPTDGEACQAMIPSSALKFEDFTKFRYPQA